MAEHEKETNIGTQIRNLIEERIKDIPDIKNKQHAVGDYVVKIVNILLGDVCDEYGITYSAYSRNLEFDATDNEIHD